MGHEKSDRIQTSLLNGVEKKILVWLAQRQPSWVTSDILTYLGVFGAFVCAVGFALASVNVYYLWLSSFGLLINWYGDSLDGTLARVRQTQRPKYGFFIDHSLDAITICIMCIGAGLSPIFRFDVALLVLVAYLVISIYTYICTILKDEFRLTYAGMGPTEFRLVIILLNTVYMYIRPLREWSCTVAGQGLGLFDIVGIAIALFIAFMWISQWLKDRKYLSKRDPLKKAEPKEQK